MNLVGCKDVSVICCVVLIHLLLDSQVCVGSVRSQLKVCWLLC